MRGDGFTPTARGADNKFRDMFGGTGRLGLNSVTQPLAQQIQRKVDLFDWRGRRQGYFKVQTSQSKGDINANNTNSRSEHNAGISLQPLTTSKVTENSIISGGTGIHNAADRGIQNKLHTDVPLNTFLLSAIDQDLPSALPSNDLDKMQLYIPSSQYAEFLDSLTRTQDTSKYDFCNPELYDDPFGDPIPTSDAHQINRVTPAQYTDNIPRIQRSLSIKQDSSTNLLGVYDVMARSMDFASLTTKPRHRLGIGTSTLAITPSASLANLLNAKGNTISKSISSKRLSKEKNRSSTTPRSTDVKSSLTHGQFSIDSDSRDSEVYPITQTSNLACFRRIESDLSSIQEKGSPPPQLPCIVTTIVPTETPLSPGTPHVLQNAITKNPPETTTQRTDVMLKTKAIVSPSNDGSSDNENEIPVTLESLSAAISAPTQPTITRHTFKSLNPIQQSQYSYLHRRSNTFKNTYTAVLSVPQLTDDNRMVMFRTKKSQHSSAPHVEQLKEETLLYPIHTNTDCDSRTHQLDSNNHTGQDLKTTHEVMVSDDTLPTISKDDVVVFKKGVDPPEKLRSMSSKVPSDTLPVITSLDKGTYKRSVSGVSSLQAKTSSGVTKVFSTKNPQPLKGDSIGLQRKLGVYATTSLTNVLKNRDPSQQLLGTVHATNVLHPSPTLHPN